MEKTKKGFTLLELLVVVLIIGILAAIALPQYQMAVGKAKFATLKNITKSLQESAQRYYLINNAYPHSSEGLDIDLNIKKEEDKGWGLKMTMKDDVTCTVWTNTTEYIACGRIIFDKDIYFYLHRNSGQPLYCSVYHGVVGDKANHLCAKETNKPIKSSCADTTCGYDY